ETFTVLAGTKQVANFTIDTTIFCANDTNKFLNLSTDSSLINTYHWEFGDGQISSQFEPIHFFKDTGWLDISLRVGYNGCYDTLIKQDYVYVKGPIAEFSYVIDCDNPFVVPFQSIMKDVTRYYWDFGDLSPLDSQQINPIHQ